MKYASSKHLTATFLAVTALLALVLLGCHTRHTLASLDASVNASLVIDDAAARTTTEHAATLAGKRKLGGTLPDGGGIAPNAITGDNLIYFGSGVDGILFLDSGTPVTLNRDEYFSSVGGIAGSQIQSANYRIYVSGTLDFSGGLQIINGSAPGTAGGNGGGGTPASGGSAGSGTTLFGTLPAGILGTFGGNSSLSNGVAAANPTTPQPCNGGGPLAGGAGGNATGGTGGAGAISVSLLPQPFYKWTESPMILFPATGGIVPTPFDAIGGSGGGGGAGTGTLSGGAGGGGGGPGGIIFISAAIVNTGGSTITAAISAKGNVGGAGGIASVILAGGGGGGAGGGGGVVILGYGQHTGGAASNMIDVSGGTGGAGGNASTSGNAGSGGGGGSSGTVSLFNLSTQLESYSFTIGSSAGSAGSGTTGGAGGAGGTLQVSF